MFFLVVLPGAPHLEHLGPPGAADLTLATRVCEAAELLWSIGAGYSGTQGLQHFLSSKVSEMQCPGLNPRGCLGAGPRHLHLSEQASSRLVS